MATATRLSLEEYLNSHYEPECELIDGELRQKPMGTSEHMSVTMRMLYALKKYVDAGIGSALPELSVRVSDDSVLIPDVAFIRHPIPPGVIKTPPLLCVEILSPSDRFSATLAKMERYYSFGVEACWIIDPIKKTVWTVSRDGKPYPENDTLRVAEIEISVSEIFR